MLNQQSAAKIDPFFGGWQVDGADGQVRMTSRHNAVAASVARAIVAWLNPREMRAAERDIPNSIQRATTAEA